MKAVRIAVTALALAAALLATPSVAQLQPCRGINDQGLKILLDDIHGADPLVQKILAQRLEAALTQWRIEGGDASAGARDRAVPISIRHCDKRRPAGAADFTEPMVRALNNAEVVLEVWAQTAKPATAGDKPLLAIVGYALVPVHHYNRASNLGIVETSDKITDVSVDELLALLNQSGRLALYADISSGVRLLKAQAFAPARTQFCSALARIRRGGVALPQADKDRLVRYVQALSVEAIQSAPAGVLKALDPTPCDLEALP